MEIFGIILLVIVILLMMGKGIKIDEKGIWYYNKNKHKKHKRNSDEDPLG